MSFPQNSCQCSEAPELPGMLKNADVSATVLKLRGIHYDMQCLYHPWSPHMAITQTCARQQLQGGGVCLRSWLTCRYLYDSTLFIRFPQPLSPEPRDPTVCKKQYYFPSWASKSREIFVWWCINPRNLGWKGPKSVGVSIKQAWRFHWKVPRRPSELPDALISKS